MSDYSIHAGKRKPIGNSDRSVCYIRKQSHLTGTLDRDSELTLILGACSGYTARNDLAIGADEPLQKLNILIVDIGNVILCEIAYLTATHSLFLESHGILLFFICQKGRSSLAISNVGPVLNSSALTGSDDAGYISCGSG